MITLGRRDFLKGAAALAIATPVIACSEPVGRAHLSARRLATPEPIRIAVPDSLIAADL